ncbi:MAG: hypothetical protein NWE83_09485 [Candidatus Bathyarchaeota archaeon]|nr:hypothetical protein [Candidatus Bathyarchaeota archaeon]
MFGHQQRERVNRRSHHDEDDGDDDFLEGFHHGHLSLGPQPRNMFHQELGKQVDKLDQVQYDS